MTTELLVAWTAIVIAAVWIVRQQLELNRRDEILDEVEEALETADKTVTLYQQILTDVAHNHATLEITDDGHIIATHNSFGKVSVH
jgi:hypothetical protein